MGTRQAEGLRSERLGTKVAAGTGYGGVNKGQHTCVLWETEKSTRKKDGDTHNRFENIKRAQVDVGQQRPCEP